MADHSLATTRDTRRSSDTLTMSTRVLRRWMEGLSCDEVRCRIRLAWGDVRGAARCGDEAKVRSVTAWADLLEAELSRRHATNCRTATTQ